VKTKREKIANQSSKIQSYDVILLYNLSCG